MKYKHNWKIDGDPGMYDTLYKCTICGERNMESADSMATWNPKYGCQLSVKVTSNAEFELAENGEN